MFFRKLPVIMAISKWYDFYTFFKYFISFASIIFFLCKFQCHACSATFGDKVQLNSHYRQTHVENSVKIFVDETELIPTVEVRPESPELFECPVCHRVYRQQEPFAKHLKSHSTGSAKRGNPKEDEIESKPKRSEWEMNQLSLVNFDFHFFQNAELVQ